MAGGEAQPRVRLRQAVLVARELEPVAGGLRSALGLHEPFRDPGVGEFGLTNAVFALGDCFLEVVSPARAGTAAGRYLDRHGGDGGYMVIFDRCRRLIAERREHPSDDLTSVLVHAEVEGERLDEQEIVMGFFLLMAAGNDSTKATYCSGMRAILDDPEQRRLLLEDPSLIPSAVEESLRMFPAFAHFARTATCDAELAGQTIRKGEKVVMWYVSSNREESRYAYPERFEVRRNPEHQAFGAGGRHFCLGTALARLELRILFEETFARYPAMERAGPAAS